MSDNTSVAFEDIQTAVFSLLDNEVSYQDPDGNTQYIHLFDEVSEKDSEFPMVTYDTVADSEKEARRVRGRHVVLSFNIYSRDAGGKFECYRIQAAIVEKMTEGKLSMTNWKEVQKTYRAGKVERDKEYAGIQYRANVTFLLWVSMK